MLTFYLFIVVILFILAISDLIVGVSNDAVNFLNSAVGAKTASFKTIVLVAALGIIVGCTFSGGMMEVARKGIFHPQFFYFSEIVILFLAVMVTDVILLDTFNTFGMPTSTTVSIVFELLGAAVAIAIIKVSTDPDALRLGEYINSEKALAIIAGILLSVIVAFTSGVILQYITRLMLSFDYRKRLKYFGGLWGGLAFAAITFFMVVKGAKGASFMSGDLLAAIKENTVLIVVLSFVAWAIVLQLLTWFTKVDIMKVIVLAGTFALAMAFAGNDLVNFIGVPLAGYNSYELFVQSGGATPAGQFLMEGLAGKVPTPTLLLLLAGVIMAGTLYFSKKAKSVIKTSVDLGRQYEGAERFASYAVSRSLVRNFGKFATQVNSILPAGVRNAVERQFDEKPFLAKQAKLGKKKAPSFDMVRAASTLVVASILISIGTTLKLPLSTTYVTFMVFMGTSLADGAWGRESAVYRVSGVLSVVGGWFFTALSAFTVAFILACLFYFGGMVAILAMLVVAAVLIYRTYKLHGRRLDEQIAFEKSLDEGTMSKAKVIEESTRYLNEILTKFSKLLKDTLKGLEKEDLPKLNKTFSEFKKVFKETEKRKNRINASLDRIDDNELEAAHLYILVVEYLWEAAHNVNNIVKPTMTHVDNGHKPLLSVQLEELKTIQKELGDRFEIVVNVFRSSDEDDVKQLVEGLQVFVKLVRTSRKNQIKRIRKYEIGTRNSVLFFNHLAEFRNLAMFTNRMAKVYHDLIMHPGDEEDFPFISNGV
ncbi:MAG: inorganic phosphate transporter [Saprospiraceae bacterium]